MSRMLSTLSKFGVVVLALGTAAVMAQAQYPNRPVRIVVPYGPGSGTDILARTLAEPLGQALGQPIVVENKAGANSMLGTDIVAKAAPDGYTLGLATNAGLAASPGGLSQSVPYDAERDLAYITRVASVSFVLLVNNKLAVNSPRELIDYVKANPGKLSYASGNTGGIAYMGYLKRAYELDITHVPYKSTPSALVDLMSGQVEVMMADVASSTPRIRAGQLKALGVAADQRSPLLPEVPTLDESGVANVPDMSGWWALVGPAGMPAGIADRLNREFVEILGREDVREKMLRSGLVATPSTREQAARYQQDQLEVWSALVRDLGLQAQ
ncbi:MAG: tripartite tricarboxylate transporter substrate binding protein [Burkholderiaceae bacterium]